VAALGRSDSLSRDPNQRFRNAVGGRLRKDIKFFDSNESFNSVASTLRDRRRKNAKAQLLRDGFLADFDFDEDDLEDDLDDEVVDEY